MPFWKALTDAGKRLVAISLTVLLLVLIVVGLSYCHERRKAQTAKANERVADAQATLGADAAITTADQVAAESENAGQTAKNREDILRAENANETAGDAGDRGLRVLCERVQYRNSERCIELRRADRADAPR